ncbi:hypothetical protein CspeluHIS016_0504950 [Cutaneotrichosporon spelunceum]|uniref:Cytochrome b5 heme-binding domain-containing protein n=1 Tax=Cutaneotrichosporon spelunceum TaxID=1672016 RepID=A0AAD3YDU5_9TREE|nr:hypothetical protein CspeluHIS016_0504950 [Cutaneotrichosporon spelunceum]
MSEVRHRQTAADKTNAAQTAQTAPEHTKTKSSGTGIFLALVLVLALGAAAAIAYISQGERSFSMKALSAYSGSPDRPVYISIDGIVYDVSANRRVYGQGGSYNMMAGRDASRSFITGCFETHLTHDLRGLSEKDLESLETWKNFF